MIDVVDLRGKDLGDPARKSAYPRETYELGVPMTYIHLQSSRWYFDASDPANEGEASRVIADLCFTAETWSKAWSAPYKPFRVIVDNFGGTILGQRGDGGEA